MGDTRRIEWPPRSGAFADYGRDEEDFLRVLISGCEDGYLDEEQLAREVGVLHDLKSLMQARIVGDGDAGDEDDGFDYDPPPPDSPFQIPGRAADLLHAHDPQLRI